MPGNLSIPHVFATQSGNVPASQLDNDYNAIRDYVNAREVTQGTLAARPAAGVSGRWYFANDDEGGTLYLDTGSTWVAVGRAVAFNGYRVVGQTSTNNAGTPNTQFDLDADVVVLHNPSTGGAVVRRDPGVLANNISTAGPAANGRDQAGAFSANSWVHFYWIWNGTTLATISSASAPTGATGPTLPTGYTHWAYAGAVRLDGSGNLKKVRIRGAKVFYEARENVLSNGNATTETSVSLAAVVPPNALTVLGHVRGQGITADAGNGDATAEWQIRVVTGVDLIQGSLGYSDPAGAGTRRQAGPSFEIPNVGQAFLYLWTVTTGTSPTLTVDVIGYTVPNGGE